MKAHSIETSPLLYARIAGVLYLLIIVCGILSEVFIRSRLIIDGDATVTVTNILTSEGLFRIGFTSDSIMLLCDVAIAVIFYVLLKPVSNTLSLTAAAFRLTQAAILGMNLLHYYAVMILLHGTGYSAALETVQMNNAVMFFLDMHAHGYDIGLIFFGISCLILGYLTTKSEYFPGILGYGLVAAGVVYLTGSLTLFIAPNIASLIEPIYIVPFIAELSFCLWLLIKGVKDQP